MSKTDELLSKGWLMKGPTGWAHPKMPAATLDYYAALRLQSALDKGTKRFDQCPGCKRCFVFTVNQRGKENYCVQCVKTSTPYIRNKSHSRTTLGLTLEEVDFLNTLPGHQISGKVKKLIQMAMQARKGSY